MGNHGQGRARCGPDFGARRRFQSYLIKVLRAVGILRNFCVPRPYADWPTDKL